MSPEYDRVTWAEIAPAAARMFHVWLGDGEIRWVEECWHHLGEAGLTEKTTALEEAQTYLRLVILARAYEEFCGCAWDENPETSLMDLADELDIDLLALGILGALASPDGYDECGDEHELREAALTAATEAERQGVFDCLSSSYGDPVSLYSRMCRTNSSSDDGDEFDVTGSNSAALSYVMNGFRFD